MATGVMKKISQMGTSISMVIWLFFLVLVCCGLQLADGKGCLDDTITLEHGFRGQLKFCDSHYWGAVCSLDKHNEEFIQVNSQVVCYELGYSGDGTDFTTGSNPENYFVLVKVHCQGDEERLSECHKEEITPKEIIKCKHTHESVYVTCPKESQVRLHNYQDSKTRDYHGVVEHWYNGTWHILCDTGNWTLNDSQVVCQQLGLGEAVEPVHKYEGKIGTLDYLQNNICCHNNENMIRNCRVEKHWNTTSTCNVASTFANVMCQGPVVQDITIISRTQKSITFSWKLPPNFFYYNPVVVTEFHVEYWPKGHPSEMRSFNRSSVFNDATMDLLDPDTTYELMIVTMMGEHHGPNSSVWSVKTIEKPVDAAIVILSCALTALSCIFITILSIAMIRCIIIRRRRQGYEIIQNGNGRGCFVMFCYYCVQEQPVIVNGEQEQDAIVNGEQEMGAIVDGEQEMGAIVDGEQEMGAIVDGKQEMGAIVDGKQEMGAIVDGEQEQRIIVDGGQEQPVIIDGERFYDAPDQL